MSDKDVIETTATDVTPVEEAPTELQTNAEMAARIASHIKGSISRDGAHLVIPVEAIDGIFKEKLVGVSKGQLEKAQRAELLMEAGIRQATIESAHAYMVEDREITRLSSKTQIGLDELSVVVTQPKIEDGAIKGRYDSTRRTTSDGGLFGEIMSGLDAYALAAFSVKKD